MAMRKARYHIVWWTAGRRTPPRLRLCIFLWRRSRFPWRYGTQNLFLSRYPNICLLVSLGYIQPPVWKQKFRSQEGSPLRCMSRCHPRQWKLGAPQQENHFLGWERCGWSDLQSVLLLMGLPAAVTEPQTERRWNRTFLQCGTLPAC